MIPYAQAGIMLHPAAELRNASSTTPYLAAGRCGLPRSLASDAALSPSTIWVPPSDRLAFHLDHRHPAGQTVFNSLNSDTAKSGQHQSTIFPDAPCPRCVGFTAAATPLPASVGFTALSLPHPDIAHKAASARPAARGPRIGRATEDRVWMGPTGSRDVTTCPAAVGSTHG